MLSPLRPFFKQASLSQSRVDKPAFSPSLFGKRGLLVYCVPYMMHCMQLHTPCSALHTSPQIGISSCDHMLHCYISHITLKGLPSFFCALSAIPVKLCKLQHFQGCQIHGHVAMFPAGYSSPYVDAGELSKHEFDVSLSSIQPFRSIQDAKQSTGPQATLRCIQRKRFFHPICLLHMPSRSVWDAQQSTGPPQATL